MLTFDMGTIDSWRITETGLGFWQARCLLSAIELGVFTELGRGPMTRSEVASALGIHPKGAVDFLDGLVAMRFLEREGNGDTAHYSNGEEAARFLDRNSPDYMAGYLEMAASRLFPFWAGLTETLRTGRPQNEARTTGAAIFETLYSDPDRVEQYMRAMSGMGRANFQAFARKFDFSPYQTLCDVGGASGQFSLEVVRANPHMRCSTCDLPAASRVAKRTIEEARLEDRIDVLPCDMFDDPFPSTDVLTMGMVLHNWDVGEKKFLIRKAYKAIRPGGAFAVIEHLIDDDRRENVFGLMMSLNMLVSCGYAADFTGREFRQWCLAAGFSRTEVLQLAGSCSAAVAWKSVE